MVSMANPDEAVAIGAAFQAAVLSDEESKPKFVLVDVAPLSLGIYTADKDMSFLIKMNKTIPYQNTREYETMHDNQTSVEIKVYEGEFKVTLVRWPKKMVCYANLLFPTFHQRLKVSRNLTLLLVWTQIQFWT